ncbi:MAG: hypothetical protein WBP93_18360 [Pyrinomonadaceae bacterium]
MSSLIFHTDEEQAFVATDTLATSPSGEPFMFTTKTFIVPHLRMLMCGTGIAGFLGRWFIRVNDRMIVRCVDHLNDHTPNRLVGLWREHREEFSIPDTFSTTVYHFGFSSMDGLIHPYAYRSTNNFKSEALQYGIGVKPECQVPQSYCLPTDIKKIMDEQRVIEATKPKNEKIYIGGEILIHHLTKSGFNVYTLDRFDDYELDERAIYKNYDSLSKGTN